MRRWIVLLVALLLGAAGLSPAWAAPSATEATVLLRVDAAGTLEVTATLQVAGASEVSWRLPLERGIDSTQYHRYEIQTSAQHTVEGTQLLATTPVENGQATLSYTVVGATRSATGQSGGLTIVDWPALAGLDFEVASVIVDVDGPATVQFVDCTAGHAGTVGQCALISGGTYETPEPQLQDGPLEAGQEIVVQVGYPAGEVVATADVRRYWSLDRAFELSWATATAALGVALIGAALLYLLHRRSGRDLTHSPEIDAIAGFTPTGHGESVFEVTSGIRPGHVGTVADEHVDPIDITATLVDLAVRGQVRFVELPAGEFEVRDWRIERLDGPDGDLAPFERALLDGVLPDGASTLVSELPARLAPCLPAVQGALYDEVVARGWFEARPDATRSWWRLRGWIGLALTVVAGAALVAFTNLGLAALALVGLGGGLVWVAGKMPRRTAAGAALLRGLEALAGLLATHPTNHMPAGRELEEISRLLGYTVVLGGKERWLAALVAADGDDAPDPTALSWYHAPDSWHLQHLPASLTQLITTLQGQLTGRSSG